jgi:hypothetical protein
MPLTSEQRAPLTGFFSTALLESTRLLVLQSERVPNPAFYAALRALGFHNLPDFALMAAVTFSDVVVSHQPFTGTLLFHELVHVEQHRQLGIPRFAELYVRGFLSGGGYDHIPLEINAYALEALFAAHLSSTPTAPPAFSVAAEVSNWITHSRF